MTEAELVSYLQERRSWVKQALEKFLPAEEAPPAPLSRAVRYSVLTEGKRLRPILCMAACEAVGGDPRRALGFGCALEYVHAYSLIHDDLPVMDNDDFRRGQPTCHKVFGEAVAILAGDALNSEAFGVAIRAAGEAGLKPAAALAIVAELAQASGLGGIVAGQVMDLLKQRQPCSPEELDFIHRRKTGALIRAAARIGALAAGCGRRDLGRLTRYGEAAGQAFQIKDDLLDEASSDQGNLSATYVSVHGREPARAKAAELRDQALAAIQALGAAAEPLRVLARYIVDRET
jgi:geranylgeranyl diphosphate synthase type II